MKIYLYVENNKLVKVLSKRKPSENNTPRSGTWVGRIRRNGKWEMPSFPEITWNILKKMDYIGELNGK